jgi:hypothetical protein
MAILHDAIFDDRVTFFARLTSPARQPAWDGRFARPHRLRKAVVSRHPDVILQRRSFRFVVAIGHFSFKFPSPLIANHALKTKGNPSHRPWHGVDADRAGGGDLAQEHFGRGQTVREQDQGLLRELGGMPARDLKRDC